MGKYILTVNTNWCGEDNQYGILTNDITNPDLESACDIEAYENFSMFSGFDAVLSELFPDVEDEDYSDEQIDEAGEVEHEYFGYTLEKFDGSDGDFEYYELFWED